MILNLKWRRVTSEAMESVTYEIIPLSTVAYQSTLSLAQDPDNNFRELLETVLPGHVRDIQGITLVEDKGDRDAAPEDIWKQSLLMPLGAEMIKELMDISSLTKAEEKNSEGPPQGSGAVVE